ncbi:HlyD family secretion protein [Bordetella sp. BOR01]|uniref:HlyD family secretion protein n=1 Tax=Bordetella sp. BOR01 TaxID=2854779 RepID=UPI001C466D2A|nr:HlyD family efflux transporter periplasmic adaptor subunit [Bordetella sp. BOR01]MBV7485878.1 HlyD family efflux transporter periplasmic adaptor subunit [Bordetella sp. BOR01]
MPVRSRLPAPSVFPALRRLAAVACLPLWLAACGNDATPFYQGYVEGEFVYMAASQPGRLQALHVARGQQVQAGTPLFALEAEPEADAQREAHAQLLAAQAQRQDLDTGQRPPEISVVRAQLVQAEAEAGRAAAQLARDRVQFQAGGIARAQLDDSRAQAQSSSARVRELRAQLEVAALPGRDQQLRAQDAQVEAARAALAQADWALAQKQVASVQAARVFDTLFRPGEWVPAGSPVVRMLPPGNIKLRFFVPETTLGALHVGDRILVRCDACGEPLPASVSYLSTEAEYTPPVIYSRDSRGKLVYMVEAHPAAQDAVRLHPGQPVEVTLP